MTNQKLILSLMDFHFNGLNVAEEIKIEKDDALLCYVLEKVDPILRAIKKYKNHPSILRIKYYLKKLKKYFR